VANINKILREEVGGLETTAFGLRQFVLYFGSEGWDELDWLKSFLDGAAVSSTTISCGDHVGSDDDNGVSLDGYRATTPNKGIVVRVGVGQNAAVDQLPILTEHLPPVGILGTIHIRAVDPHEEAIIVRVASHFYGNHISVDIGWRYSYGWRWCSGRWGLSGSIRWNSGWGRQAGSGGRRFWRFRGRGGA
jgi:hypothetical protein